MCNRWPSGDRSRCYSNFCEAPGPTWLVLQWPPRPHIRPSASILAWNVPRGRKGSHWIMSTLDFFKPFTAVELGGYHRKVLDEMTYYDYWLDDMTYYDYWRSTLPDIPRWYNLTKLRVPPPSLPLEIYWSCMLRLPTTRSASAPGAPLSFSFHSYTEMRQRWKSTSDETPNAGRDLGQSVEIQLKCRVKLPWSWVIKCPHFSHHPTIRYMVYN